MDYLIIGMKLIIGLIALMVVIRLLGKKHLAEMTPYDIIYLIVFGGILEVRCMTIKYPSGCSFFHWLYGR